jgi:predicted dehydrogenase
MERRMKTDRRRFLQGTLGAAAAAWGIPYIVRTSALGKSGRVAPNDRINMGCIGVGSRGTGNMRGFLNVAGVQVVAVCDVWQSRRQKAKQIVDEHYGTSDCATYTDFRELLKRQDVDAVMIATQDHWHALIAVAAARAGKDIYCEKPLGVAVTECRAILDAVRRYGRVFQTGTQQRSDQKFRFACELARNGYLGKIHTVKVASEGPNYKPGYKGPYDPMPAPDGLDFDMYLGPAPKKPYNPGRLAWPDWYLIWDYCDGFIVNWAVHHLDIANWGCPGVAEGPFEFECKGTYRNEGFTDNINDWSAEFRYQSGLRMTFTDYWGENKSGCRFEGDKGWVYVDRPGIWAEPESLLKVNLKADDLHLHESNNHQRDFIESVRTRRDPVSDAEAGHKASYLGMIADISARLKRTLKWDPAKERFVNDPEADRMLTRPMRTPWHL